MKKKKEEKRESRRVKWSLYAYVCLLPALLIVPPPTILGLESEIGNL